MQAQKKRNQELLGLTARDWGSFQTQLTQLYTFTQITSHLYTTQALNADAAGWKTCSSANADATGDFLFCMYFPLPTKKWGGAGWGRAQE
jgi:hypothetical protein